MDFFVCFNLFHVFLKFDKNLFGFFVNFFIPPFFHRDILINFMLCCVEFDLLLKWS